MKEQKLESLQNEILETYKKVFQKEIEEIVFGQGNLECRIMMIGEAPGSEEIKQKRPFVGAAGKNLDYFLEVVSLAREDLYITNVVKFRPYKVNEKTNRKVNRPPNKKELFISIPLLKEEIEVLQPKFIVTLGNVPLKALLGESVNIGEVHGKKQSYKEYSLFPLYHPASIIYNQSLKGVYEEDLKLLQQVLT